MTSTVFNAPTPKFAMLWILTGLLWVAAPAATRGQQAAAFNPNIAQSGASARNASLSGTGVSTVRVQPRSLTMLSQVSGSAQLAADAMVKYRDAKRRAVEMLEGLDVDGLSVDGLGRSLSFKYDNNTLNNIRRGKVQPGEANAKPTIIASEGLRIRVTGLQDRSREQLNKLLIKLIDSTQDAGLAVGGLTAQTVNRYGYNSNSMSVFAFQGSISDQKRQEAVQKAIKKARADANRLADQADVSLGPVLSVSQNLMSGNHNRYNNNRMQMLRAQMSQAGQASNQQTIVTDKLGDTTVRVSVEMRFAMEPKE